MTTLRRALLAAAVAAAAAAPRAAEAASATLTVAPEQAASATVTLPANGRATLTAGTTKAKLKTVGSRIAVRGRRLDPARDPRAGRLLIVNTAGVTSVTLNAQPVVARTRATAIRLEGRGLRVRDRLFTSVADPLDRLAQRAGVLHLARPNQLAYVGQGTDHDLHFRELRNWSAGFLPSLLWTLAAEKDSALLARWGAEAVRDLRRIPRFDDPDVGFVMWRSALRAHALGCTPGSPPGFTAEECDLLLARARQAGDRLVARAASNPLGLIPTAADESRCSQCLPGELRVIVDQLHNLPALTFDGDPARVALAANHARWVAANLVRPDGAVYQEGFIDRFTGTLTRRGNYQGLTSESVWARGQAWAISGLARNATTLQDPELLAAAVRAADWWIANAPAGVLPPYDFAAPPEAPRDSSALAIAASGFRALATRCAETAACDATRYAAAADAATLVLLGELETGAQLGRLGDGAYTVGGLPWDEAAELPWGTDFLAELLAG